MGTQMERLRINSLDGDFISDLERYKIPLAQCTSSHGGESDRILVQRCDSYGSGFHDTATLKASTCLGRTSDFKTPGIEEKQFFYNDFPSKTEWKPIGEGQFSHVYKTYRISDGKSCAIKELKAKDSEKFMEEFRGEVEVLIRMHHKNIVQLIGTFTLPESSLPVIITPYYENKDVTAFYKTDAGRAITIKTVLKWCYELADGVTFLASKPVIHRDLAARNCMLDATLTLKISDFGLAKNVEEIEEPIYFVNDEKRELAIKWLAIES